MKRKIIYVLFALSLIFVCFALVIYPERYVSACLTGFVMWAECVLPSLFPFTIVTLLFVKTGFIDRASLPLRRVSGIFNLPPSAGLCFLVSILSGYPTGARLLLEMYEGGTLTRGDVQKLAPLCSTSGPLFILGTVGYKMLNSKSYGFALLLCHTLSVISISLIFALLSKREKYTTPKKVMPDSNILYNTFYSGVISVAVAGGFIAFFSMLGQILSDFNIFYPLEKLLYLFLGDNALPFLNGLIEVTSGSMMLSKTGSPIALPLIGFLVTFGGACILCQQLAYLKKAKISTIKFLSVKFLQATVCLILLLLFF
jgi:sporulation integral membrane protein YlbJ